MMLATPYSQRRRLQFRVCVPHSQRNAYAQTLSTDDRVDHERQKAAFASLLEPVLSLAYRVAYNLARHEANAEELVQDASILAFRHFESFEHGTNFKAWFMKILKNSFLMEARRRKRYPQTIDLSDLPDSYLYSQALAANLYATTPDPAAAMLQHVTATQLSQAMGQLPEEYHLVSVFYFVEELFLPGDRRILGNPDRYRTLSSPPRSKNVAKDSLADSPGVRVVRKSSQRR